MDLCLFTHKRCLLNTNFINFVINLYILMTELKEEDYLELAGEAMKKNTSIKDNVIKGFAYSKLNSEVRCDALIANNNKEKVSGDDLFAGYKVKYTFFEGSNSLFEVTNKDNVHPEFPHVHVGKERFTIPLSEDIAAACLSSTTQFIKDGYAKYKKQKDEKRLAYDGD